MQIIHRAGNAAFGTENGTCYILTGFAARDGKYTCTAQDEIPESVARLIGPIEGVVTAMQRRVIEAAIDLCKAAGKVAPTGNHSQLAQRVLSAVQNTPNALRAPLFWLNIANPFIYSLYKEYCHEHRLPLQYPISDAERIDFEIHAIGKLLGAAQLYYSGEPEKRQQKTA